MVSNSAPESIANINEQFDRFGCPMPAISGLWNDTGTITYSGARYNYNGNLGTGNNVTTLTCTYVHTADGQDYYYGCPTCVGMFVFAGDWLSELGNKLSAFFVILAFILTPANFNVLGYTLDDIGGQALMMVIALYAVCYIAIGALIYKIISPFSGAS